MKISYADTHTHTVRNFHRDYWSIYTVRLSADEKTHLDYQPISVNSEISVTILIYLCCLTLRLRLEYVDRVCSI